MTLAMNASFERVLPSKTGFHARTSASISTTAALVNLNANWGGTSEQGVTTNRILTGGAYITLTSTVDCYVVRTTAADVTNNCTSTTGEYIKANTPTDYWIPSTLPQLDVLGSSSGTLYYYFSSRNMANVP